jgi:hypothetical protein
MANVTTDGAFDHADRLLRVLRIGQSHDDIKQLVEQRAQRRDRG